jgi:hypothetical protein
MFKFTPEEIEKMEDMINNFEKDTRKPFLSGTEMEVRVMEMANSRNYSLNYSIKFSIEAEDEDEE